MNLLYASMEYCTLYMIHVYAFLLDRLDVNVTANECSAWCIAPFIGCQTMQVILYIEAQGYFSP
jgi:hypothetical protein